MSLAHAYSAQLIGLKAETVTIEVDISNGLHSFAVVGLGDRAVEEAKDRISAAIKNTGFTSPKQKNQKVVISLAPADLPKEGTAFDLAMAMGYLAASGEIGFDPENMLFLGELSLEGRIRKIPGVLPILEQAASSGFREVFVPAENVHEASLSSKMKIYAVSSLRETIKHIKGEVVLRKIKKTAYKDISTYDDLPDMGTIRGNETAKRGLEIAAAGAHNVLMRGPMGTGKTMLARSFPSIMPPLSYDEAIEVTSIHSAARTLDYGLVSRPPFRSPHHTASYISIVGGGAFPHPGEITLAHRGILYLDELPEFDKRVIDALREPLEEGAITISRARGTAVFPAKCMLIASMNSCPCGREREKGCICPQNVLERYRRRISGPIMDRVDIFLEVNKVDYDKLSARSSDGESSKTIRSRVALAQAIQAGRFRKAGRAISRNSEMTAKDIEKFVKMEDDARAALLAGAEKFELSGRAFHRIMKVAQTIADLAAEKVIRKERLLEAMQYRQRTL